MKKRIFASAILLLFCATLLFADQYASARKRMVDTQIRARGIKSADVLRAMETVPRHLYIPAPRRGQAYNDHPVPIGYGQTISQPYIVAYMTELLQPKPNHRVLEIGTGSGYQAAILAEIVDKVYTVEIVEELAKSSSELLKNLGYDNIKVKHADGYYGWEEHAPFDSIMVTAAAEFVPPPLIKQLKVGGIMCIPVGPPFHIQTLYLIRKVSEENIETTVLGQVRFVPLTRKEGN
jgi:protein-L-isoaspartate(D-aspartate) O-methyltransferase